MLERLALFTGSYNHIVDGVSLTLNRLVAYLQAQGIDVMVLGPTIDNPPLQGAGTFVAVPSTSLPGRPDYRLSLRPTRATRQELREFDPQIVHVATPDLLGLYALRFSNREDIPLVSSFHTNFSSYLKHYNLGLMEGCIDTYLKWFYHKCEHVYVPTPLIKEELAQKGFNGRLRIWGRGVDMEVFNPNWRSQTWRESMGVGPDEVLVTFVGRLVWEKGLQQYAKIVEQLQAGEVSFRSMVVGDGRIRNELAAELPDTIFTGHLQGDDLSRAFASSDVFLYPSDSEAFGNVIVEAMASGLPVVAAGGVGSSNHVRAEETGLLAAPEDIDAFTCHTRRLIENPDERRKMGAAAREVATTEYDWQSTLRLLKSHYEELLSSKQMETTA